MQKEYLGDAVYVEHDGYALVLTTEDGISTTNTIYLEPEVLKALMDYVARLSTLAETVQEMVERLQPLADIEHAGVSDDIVIFADVRDEEPLL